MSDDQFSEIETRTLPEPYQWGLTAIVWTLVAWILFAGPCDSMFITEERIANIEKRVETVEHNGGVHWGWIKTICHETASYTERGDCP